MWKTKLTSMLGAGGLAVSIFKTNPPEVIRGVSGLEKDLVGG